MSSIIEQFTSPTIIVRVKGVLVEVVDDEVQGGGQLVHGEIRVEVHVVDVHSEQCCQR